MSVNLFLYPFFRVLALVVCSELCFAAMTRPPTRVPTFAPTYIPATDYSCVHSTAWLVNTNGQYSTKYSSTSDITTSKFVNSSVSTTGWQANFTGIPFYGHTFTDSEITALNRRPDAADDFTSGATTAVAGNYYEFGEDLGYSSSTCTDGYWPKGPTCPSAYSGTFTFTVYPSPETGDCYVPAHSGYFVNGVPFWSWTDATTYNSEGVWHNLAMSFEQYDMDVCVGHTASGVYHHHSVTPCLMTQLNDTGAGHSPVHGFAYDGYPVYGPYQAADTLAVSCWDKRDYSSSVTGCSGGGRTCTLVDSFDYTKGTTTASSSGPDPSGTVSTQSGNSISAASGCYYEDFYFNSTCAALGDQYLDSHNGHSHGSYNYHYHLTMNSSGTPTFPYTAGPKFYGCRPNNGPCQTGLTSGNGASSCTTPQTQASGACTKYVSSPAISYPTMAPTLVLTTKTPTLAPTSCVPSPGPTRPTRAPSTSPASVPSFSPSVTPSCGPTAAPSTAPTASPSVLPSLGPSVAPTLTPSASPSLVPSLSPSAEPSLSPTASPSVSMAPTLSLSPTTAPTIAPSLDPSAEPTPAPSTPPSLPPSCAPSVSPTTYTPTTKPTLLPSALPSAEPSMAPSREPSLSPTLRPTLVPTAVPSLGPSLAPSLAPTLSPSLAPSNQVAPVISFTTSATLSGLTSPDLDEPAQRAIVNATAASLGVSSDYVSYAGSTAVTSRRHLTVRLQSVTYTVTASTDVVIPLVNYANYSSLNTTEVYLDLVQLFSAAMSSGDFVASLTSASAHFGTNITANVTVLSHSVTAEAVVAPPSYSPTSGPPSASSALLSDTALYLVIGLCGGFVVLVVIAVAVYFAVKCCCQPRDVVKTVDNPAAVVESKELEVAAYSNSMGF